MLRKSVQRLRPVEKSGSIFGTRHVTIEVPQRPLRLKRRAA
jgi:hypothetical protein